MGDLGELQGCHMEKWLKRESNSEGGQTECLQMWYKAEVVNYSYMEPGLG